MTALIALSGLTALLAVAHETIRAELIAASSIVFIPVAALSGIGYYTATLLLTNTSTASFVLERRPQSNLALCWCAAVAAAEEIIWRIIPLYLIAAFGADHLETIVVHAITTCAFALLHDQPTASTRTRIKILISMAGFALIAVVLVTMIGALGAIAFHITYNITQARVTAAATAGQRQNPE